MDIRAVLIDVDGVLAVSWEPLPGAVDALRSIDEAGLPFVLITNTTSRTRAAIASTLADAGFPVGVDDVLTAPAAAAAFLREHRPGARVPAAQRGRHRRGPRRAFFATPLNGLGAAAEHTVMVGDDVESDVIGAQRNGLAGVLVRTGKCRPVHEQGVDGVRPDHVLDSIADLPGFLGLT